MQDLHLPFLRRSDLKFALLVGGSGDNVNGPAGRSPPGVTDGAESLLRRGICRPSRLTSPLKRINGALAPADAAIGSVGTVYPFEERQGRAQFNPGIGVGWEVGKHRSILMAFHV